MSLTHLSLFVLRISVGTMMLFGHGWRKMTSFPDLATRFADPLGFGTQISLGLAVFAEVFCAFLVIIGLMTRFAAIPILITMLVAFFLVHGDDPWARKELAALFAVSYLVIMIGGPGALALDNRFCKRISSR